MENNTKKIYHITSDEAEKIIFEWENNPEANKNLYICENIYEDEIRFVGIDNTDGNCWTEEFNTLEEAKDWLLNVPSKKKNWRTKDLKEYIVVAKYASGERIVFHSDTIEEAEDFCNFCEWECANQNIFTGEIEEGKMEIRKS